MLIATRNSRQFRLTMKEFLSFRGARRGKSIRTAGNYYRRPVGAPSVLRRFSSGPRINRLSISV